MRARIWLVCLALLCSLLASGCRTEGCLRGDEGCEVPSPCQEVSFTCDDESVEVFVVESGAQVPGGIEALGAVGDVVMRNSEVTVVIDAIDNPNLLSQTGGFILDISTTGDDNDTLNQVFHTTGALSEDFAVYQRMRLIEGPGLVAVQVEGHLFGDERNLVYTRYELRACDRGVRVRTELINRGEDDFAWTAGDGWWWGNRQNVPFAPIAGAGYQHPAFGLSTLTQAFREQPYFVASSHTSVSSSLASVPCSHEVVAALHSGQVSFSGTPLTIVTPGDYLVFERMHLVADGKGLQPASDLALEVRQQLRGARFATLSGQVSLAGGRDALGEENRATVHISRGLPSDPPEARVPTTIAIPDENGVYSARVPDGADYVLEFVAFGDVVATEGLTINGDIAAPAVELPAAGTVRVTVNVDGAPGRAQLFVYPADDETRDKTERAFHGVSTVCPVLLGYQFGDSPACNRVLTEGTTTFDIPAGEYFLFATIGTFGSLGRARITVLGDDDLEVEFELERLPGVTPANTLGADFHVHGGPSFDTAIPDRSRVHSFLAQGLDVIAATEHDAIYDYEETLAALNVTPDDLILLVGLETTAFILQKFNPDVTFPQVVGHWNFWPLRYRPDQPRNGAPFDELAEPGLIFTRVKQADLPAHGVIQMNHPWGEIQFGRDLGWARALRLNMHEPLPVFDDGTAKGLFVRRPQGSEFRNIDFDTQEVMNGTSNQEYLAHRAVWFWLLNQGIAKAGTANSDSHSLTDSVVGTPRTLVFTETERGPDFDPVVFNEDVKAGHMIGTNGPVIEASVIRPAPNLVTRPGLQSFPPAPEDALHIRVTAAPWIDVEEIRIIVNGEVVRTITEGITNAENPFGTDEILRFEDAFLLSDFLPNNQDSWLIIEAGSPLPLAGDLDCDGVPDTSDNNDDGVVDFRDVERAEPLEEEPPECEGGIGPFEKGIDAPDVDDDRFGFFAVTPKGYPLAFTNPFLLDGDGGGFGGPGLEPR